MPTPYVPTWSMAGSYDTSSYVTITHMCCTSSTHRYVAPYYVMQYAIYHHDDDRTPHSSHVHKTRAVSSKLEVHAV